MKPRELVMRFRIELLGVSPAIWRRIDVPGDCSFWDLHVAIQDAMGWSDSHLHMFHVLDEELTIGIPDEDFSTEIAPGWKVAVREHMTPDRPLASYEYDFGDSWIHEIRLEDHVEPQPRTKYPRCVAGANRCPPEDCGGPHGYGEFLEAINDPAHADHASMREWVGGDFDPAAFDPASVRFEDPRKRLRAVLGAGG